MKKIYPLLLALVVFSCTNIRAQTWSALGSGIQGQVNCMVVCNGNLYAGGEFTLAGNITVGNIAEWDGTAWHTLGTGLTGNNAEVFSLVVYNNELYAGGEFSQAGSASVNNLAKWDGSTWSDVGGGITFEYPEIDAMAVYNNRLIVGGNFNLAGTLPVQNIAAWDGTSWSGLDTTTLWTSFAMISSMYVWNGNLYVGSSGVLQTDSVATSMARWNDTAWTVLEDTLITKHSIVDAFTEFNGNLYAGGEFYTSAALDTINYDVAMWTGTGWQGVALCYDVEWDNGVDVLAAYNGDLFMGGVYFTVNGAPDTSLAKWDGTSWQRVAIPPAAPGATYFTSCLWNGSLYLAGIFDWNTGGASDALSIVQYTAGTNDINEARPANKLKLYPNPVNNQLIIENSEPGTPVVITNLLGQAIVKAVAESTRQIIDVSALTPGMYFVNGAKFVKE